MRTRRTLTRLATVFAVLVITTGASASTMLPTPGTAEQVRALVAASTSIETLPSNLVPSIAQAASDSPGAYYRVANRACDGVSKCVFGDTASTSTIVLYGDSHAQMWLPALVPVAQAAHERLVLVWEPGCPAASVDVWSTPTHSVDTSCNRFRTSMISRIKKLDPTLVLLSDRTSDIPGVNNKPTTFEEWRSGLEKTITKIKTSSTRVAIVGDITVFSPLVLPECLASFPTSVQTCSVNNPNGKTRQQFAAERAAARAKGVVYINPRPWLCTTVCSAVIGNMVAYFDAFHVSATYAEYLSGVWATALKPLLQKHPSDAPTRAGRCRDGCTVDRP
jgi:SGNH domain (fused to AT3 domains)